MMMHATLHGMTDSKGGRRRATYEDVLNAPEDKIAEIIDGVLYLSPRPALPHNFAALALGDELVSPFQKSRGGPGGWLFFVEPELHLDRDVLVPDLSAWRRTRLPERPDSAFITLAPDWVCEVLSPSTAKFDRTKKLQVYARENVRHAWFVDARRKTLEVLTLHGSTWVTQEVYHSHERVRAEPFDAIEIELAFLWDEEPASQNPTGA
jgi:Uma2 family endonuclease